MFQKDTTKITSKTENLNRLLIKLGIFFNFPQRKPRPRWLHWLFIIKKKKKNCKHHFLTLSQKAKKKNTFQHIKTSITKTRDITKKPNYRYIFQKSTKKNKKQKKSHKSQDNKPNLATSSIEYHAQVEFIPRN